jgi:soluble lytic murein transglycosylase
MLPAAPETLEPPLPPYPWADYVRLERWDEAQRGLDALTEEEKNKGDIRYARARVALARGNAMGALVLLDGVEKELPLLTDDIARRRADAKLLVGPFAEAADYYLARPLPSSWLKASEALERAVDATRCRAACDRVVASDKRTRAQEAEARARRLRLGVRTPAEDAADARWIAIEAPDLKVGKEGDAALARVDAAHPLTAEEQMRRAKVLVDAGLTDEAIRAIDHAGSAPGRAVPRIDRLRAKADALFKDRKRALDASKAYDECVAVGGVHVGEDSFHAARALSRGDKDDEAIERYGRVASRWPQTPWADEATFLAARLHLLHGRWQKAAAGYDDYARKFPNGSERREAARGRALAHLMTKDHKLARKLFEQLADDEPDALAGARALDMSALAALRDGDRTHAVARWTEVARTRPLSWPGMVARARLTEEKAQLPPLIEPADPSSLVAAPPLAVRLPPPVDVLHRIGLDADAESFLRERENLVTSAAGAPRSVEALCMAYGMLGRAKRRYQIAQQIPATLLTGPPSAKTQWAWECVYPTPYAEQVKLEEGITHLPQGLIYAVMRQESGYDPEVVSPARAVGLLQLMPDTAKVVAEQLHVPHEQAWLTSPPHNIMLGSRYLKELEDKFHGELALAIAGYNGGPDSVARWASRTAGMDLDVFVEQIPFYETRGYVVRVMGNYARYAYLLGGEAAVPKVTLAMRHEDAP